MPSQTNRFPLLDLIQTWASWSKLPPETVLKRFCDWVVAPDFPENAFVDKFENELDPIDIFMSARAHIARMEGNALTIGGWTYHQNSRWTIDVLAAAFVIETALQEFCARTKTVLPIRGPSWRAVVSTLFAGDEHLAPPPFPSGSECAARLLARQQAEGLLTTLRSFLEQVGEKSASHSQTQPGDSIDLEYWGRKWSATRDGLVAALDKCGGDEMSDELSSLDSEWDEIGRREREKRCSATSSAEPAIANSSTLVPKGRTRGRPTGSGSYEAADAELVEEMFRAMSTTPGLSIHRAAQAVVDRAIGGGTVESKLRRLTYRYGEKYERNSA